MILLQLFFSFFLIGLVNFGGGLSIIPLLNDLVVGNEWMTQNQFIQMIAISEATPGPIGINLATYAGFQTAGILGGLLATIGIMMPSLIIIVVISHMYLKFKNSQYVQGVMGTVRPAAVGMIVGICLHIAAITLFDWPLFSETRRFIDLFDFFSIAIALVVFVVYYKFKTHPVVLIMASAILGILLL
ncbi:MAG: chromate transporter [Clostridia bacterium]